jgi:hypothetical protein
LGADVIKATRQLSGLFFSTVDVGVKEMVYSLSKYLSNPSAFLNPMQSASKLSDYMKQRYSDPSKYLYAGYNDKIAFERYGKMLGVTKNVFEKYHNYSLIMLTYADAICSQITWEASYAKALSEGKSKDEASYVADRTVMLTQGDGSVFNRPKAMSGTMRFLTKYASFFYSLHSSVATDIICFKDPKAKLHLAATLTYVIILGSMYECLISSIGKDEDEEEDKKLLKAMASTAFSAAIPVLGIGGKFEQALLEERTYQTNIPFLTEMDNVAKLINELKREDKSVEEVLPDIFKTLIPIPRATQKLFGEE